MVGVLRAFDFQWDFSHISGLHNLHIINNLINGSPYRQGQQSTPTVPMGQQLASRHHTTVSRPRKQVEKGILFSF
jgi:hypothetical protein